MGFASLIPAAAALLCLEVCVIFAVLYVKVSRRREDLLFSMLALALAATRWGSFLRRSASDLDGALYWLRVESSADFIALAVLFHLVSVAAHQPLRRPMLAACYLAGGALAALCWSDSFYQIPAWALANPTLLAPIDLEPEARGRIWYILAPAAVICGTVAVAKLSFRSRHRQEGILAPLAHHIRLFVVGGLAVLATMGIVFALQGAVVEVGRVSLQSVAVAILCVLMAVALGREVLLSEAEKRHLAQLAQFRAQAVRDVAHELKNPLAAIQMAAQTVHESVQRGVDPATQCELLEMCVDACRRLTRLINNMLDTARMEAGRKVELRIEETDVAALARSIVALQSNTTSKHTLCLDAEEDPLQAYVDGDKLHQVITNLVSNAIKYSPAGGEVVLRLWRAEDDLHFSIRDEGIGMTPEQLARIYQPFERVVDPDRKITGTGIGLHLVERLVEAHGGRISVESQPGRGSTFSFFVRAQGPDCA